ncbi:AraC family transcriptional regulator [Actinomycetospora sp. NBRC 106375]|uniref:helix-turn-helix domain-containing protein n=1 Tax=Actinomycetospora sp. NBRC 106375 TaxID=3032207 RepID=UPI0024A150B1|nr:helix-turn-helix domain-containing protein [Actinomycetospora sp. NBRC 106375]GLZ48323.1 AraC family transcriptional regulator [Actinomycetospora sp. NBRC 106375]
MIAGSSYRDRPPAPVLAALASSVWVQQVGAAPVAQRHVPHGGAEIRCVLGEEPRLLGTLTAATHRDIPAGATVVGVRLRPGVLGGLAGMPADELADEDLPGSALWRGLPRLTDVLGDAPTPQRALDHLQAFVGRSVGTPDPLVDEAVRNLMPWRGGTAALPDLLPVSERQLRRRCRAAVGVGPKELQRVLRFHGFTARVHAAVDRGAPADLAGWAVDVGYHDQAHLTRECRRLAGATPSEFVAQYRAACGGADDHDHAAAYLPMLRAHGRSVQERADDPAYRPRA